MNNIEKYIDLLKSEKEKAISKGKQADEDQLIVAAHYEAMAKAFSFAITKAELLLKDT